MSIIQIFANLLLPIGSLLFGFAEIEGSCHVSD